MATVAFAQNIDLAADRCEECGDPLGSRGFHRTGCGVGVMFLANRAVRSEALTRELGAGADWPGPYVAWRDAAACYEKAGDSVTATYYAEVRDLVALMKGPAGVAAELEEEVRCRRCKEMAMEAEAAGAGVVLAGVTGRHGLAHQFAEWLEGAGLAPNGGAVVDREGTRFYRIAWARPDSAVGGEVFMASPVWIRVAWKGFADWMPVSGSRVFQSDFNAQLFLQLAVLGADWKAAERVPAKPEKV
jgi:hypothetical protein